MYAKAIHSPLVKAAAADARAALAGTITKETAIRRYRKATGTRYADAIYIMRIATAAVAAGDL